MSKRGIYIYGKRLPKLANGITKSKLQGPRPPKWDGRLLHRCLVLQPSPSFHQVTRGAASRLASTWRKLTRRLGWSSNKCFRSSLRPPSPNHPNAHSRTHSPQNTKKRMKKVSSCSFSGVDLVRATPHVSLRQGVAEKLSVRPLPQIPVRGKKNWRKPE